MTSRNPTGTVIRTTERTTSNGGTYTTKHFERPGFWAGVVVGDIESFGMKVDQLMTFYPGEIREIARALNELAEWM